MERKFQIDKYYDKLCKHFYKVYSSTFKLKRNKYWWSQVRLDDRKSSAVVHVV